MQGSPKGVHSAFNCVHVPKQIDLLSPRPGKLRVKPREGKVTVKGMKNVATEKVF